MIEPMNCPFCGSSDVGAAGGQVHCYHCPVTLEVQNTNTFHAVELWNKRAADSEITSLKTRVSEFESQIWAVGANHCRAFIMRKQAEAVDKIKRELASDYPHKPYIRSILQCMGLRVDNLRVEADTADKAGGDL